MNNSSNNHHIMKILDIQSSNSSDSNTLSKRSRLMRRRWMLFSLLEAIVIAILIAYIIYSYCSSGRTIGDRSINENGPQFPVVSPNVSNLNGNLNEGTSEGDTGISEISDDTGTNKEKIFTIDGQTSPSLPISLPSMNDNCDQRKYDHQFGVLCNNRHCPKFQFEWPKTRRELAIVTSTKSGLRFHKQTQLISSPEIRLSLKHRSNSQTVTNVASPSASAKILISHSQIKDELHYTMGEYEAFESSAINSRTAIVINIKQKYQSIIGFGGAFSDSSSSVIMSLSMNMTKNLIDDYFGDNGIKYNMGRVTIGSSDFSTRFYTNDDLTPFMARQSNNQSPPAFTTPNSQSMERITSSPSSTILSPSSQQLQQTPASPPISQQQLNDNQLALKGQPITTTNVATVSSSNSLQQQSQQLQQQSENTDFELRRFKLVEEDYLYKIPVLKLAQSVAASGNRELQLIASMWSPPLWMKTNNFYNKGYLKGSPQQQRQTNNQTSDQSAGASSVDPGKYYETLAELKARFLEAYDRHGLRFWGLTVMNEPIMAIQPFIDFNTMLFPRNDYLAYIIKYLGPKLVNRPNLRHIKLMVHDDNRKYLPMLADPVMANNSARQYISGIAVHGYIDIAYELMDDLYEKYPGTFILSTELSSGHLPFMQKALVGNWHRGVHYMFDIMKTLQHSGSGWVDWNIALDMEGGPGWLGGRLDSPILVDKANDQYFKNPMYYALGHFSKFLEPGSIRLGMQLLNGNYDYHLEAVTFLTPSSYVVIVVLNNNPYDIPIDIRMVMSISPISASQSSSQSQSSQLSSSLSSLSLPPPSSSSLSSSPLSQSPSLSSSPSPSSSQSSPPLTQPLPSQAAASSPATNNNINNNDQLTITTVNIQAESFSTILYMI